jgi:hypothetical protein
LLTKCISQTIKFSRFFHPKGDLQPKNPPFQRSIFDNLSKQDASPLILSFCHEVDLAYRFDGRIIPVEVKNGHNAHLKSLHQFMDETGHDMAVRVWTGKYGIDEVKTQTHKVFRLINLPFYMISALPDILQ